MTIFLRQALARAAVINGRPYDIQKIAQKAALRHREVAKDRLDGLYITMDMTSHMQPIWHTISVWSDLKHLDKTTLAVKKEVRKLRGWREMYD